MKTGALHPFQHYLSHIGMTGDNERPCNELIVLGFNDTSTSVGHFVSSPREREKRERRDSTGDEREGQEER